MAEPLKKDEALAAAVREAFQRHMEAARQASQALKEKQAAAVTARGSRLTVPAPANDPKAVASVEAPQPIIAPQTPVYPELTVVPKAVEPSRPAEPVHFAEASQPVVAPEPIKAEATVTPELPHAPEPVEAPRLADTPLPVEALEPLPMPWPAQAEALAPAPQLFVEPAIADEAVASSPVAPEQDFIVDERPSAEPQPEPTALAAVETAPEAKLQAAPHQDEIDFGAALFHEISTELDGHSSADTPKMPKAASLDTPLPERLDPVEVDDTQLHVRPSRERPRMSTASENAGPPQDLDLLATLAVAPRSAPAAAAAEEMRAFTPLAPTTPAKRFGVAMPARTAPAKANKGSGKRKSLRVPAALLASAALAIGIAAVCGYFWNNPDKLQALSSLLAPPAPQETAAAPSAPGSKTGQDQKIDASLPANKVASIPPRAPDTIPASTPSPIATTPIAAPAIATPPAATRSVSTVAITLDDVDEAVQSARELTAMGNIDEARQALDSYKNGSDPRVLFALAETYDPAVVKDPGKADPAQAKAYYEAAAKAGSQDNTADRIARLALAHTN